MLFLIPYYLLLFCGTVLPSDGNHGLFSPKSLCFLLTLGTFGIAFFRRLRFPIGDLRYLFVLVCSCTFLFFWTLIALQNGFAFREGVLDQFKLFTLTLLVVLISVYYIRHHMLTFDRFLKVLVYSNFFYSLLKLVVISAVFLKVFDVFGIFEKIGIRYMSMAIVGNVVRLQTSVDILSPLLLFFVLQADRLGVSFPKGFKCVYIVVTWVSIFLSFSRFLIFLAFCGYLLFALSTSYRKMGKIFAVFALCLALLGACIGAEAIGTMVENRLLSAATFTSDDTRKVQMVELLQEAEKKPFLGLGLGASAREYLRDEKLTHSYEVQWVAFLMQFGVMGSMVLLLATGAIAYRLFGFCRVRLSFFCLFVLFLLSGLTNPYLISLTSGIIYTLFWLAPNGLQTRYT